MSLKSFKIPVSTVSILGPSVQQRHGHIIKSLVEGHEIIKGLQHLSYEERSRELGEIGKGWFILKNGRFRGILSFCINT